MENSIRQLIAAACVGVCAAASAAESVRHAEVAAPGVTLQVTFAEPVAARDADRLSAWLRDVADSVAGVYGRFPLREVPIRVRSGTGRSREDNSPVPFGRVTRRGGPAVELFIDLDRPIADFYADWTLTHELSHLLLPRISWRQRWITEGFASYYQNVLMARAGQYSPAQARQKMFGGFERGRGSRPELSPNEAAREGVRRARYKIYWSGAAIALLADIELRRRSGGIESLDVVLDRFERCCLAADTRWSGEALFTRFDALIDGPVFMPLYRRYADTPGFPDVSPALAQPAILDDIFAVRTSTN